MFMTYEKNYLLDSIRKEFDQFFCEKHKEKENLNDFTLLNDIIETENEFKIELMLPAFNKEDFSVDVNNNKLTIEGERKINNNTNYTVKESYFGKFKRKYILPDNADNNNINAKYENGVLKISISKIMKKTKKKTIEIT